MRVRKQLKWGFLPSLFCLLALLVAACGSTPGQPTTGTSHQKASTDKQVFSPDLEYGVGDIATFDPALVQDAPSIYAINDVFTGLIELNDQEQPVCYLCSTYSVGPDKVTWTFKLKPNLKFSDGTPLTSQDVVYSINRALAPSMQSPVAPYYLRYIKDATDYNGGKVKTLIGDSLKTPDPDTVVIIASQPVPFFLDTLTYPTSYVVEKSVIDKWGKNWTDHLADNGGQGGDGPWKVQEYTHSKQIVFVPNPYYYGKKPQLNKLVYTFYKEQDTTYDVYQVDGIDMTTIPIPQYTAATKRPDFHKVPQLWINYYTMNYLQKPFDVTECRQMFSLAINRDLIVSSVWKGSLIPTYHIVPQGMYGYNPSLTGPDNTTATAGDPAKAKQLLATCMSKEGYSSVSQFPSITLTYASGGSQAAKNEVSAMQQMWQSTLGISVKINDIDFNKLIGDEALGCSNPLQFYAGPAWITDYPDPEDWTTLQFDKGAAQNSMCFGQNKGPDASLQQSIQQQLEQADLMQDPTARLHTYNQLEQQLVNEVAWMPVEQVTTTYLLKPCVQGFALNAQGLIPPDDWSNVYISTDTPCAKTS
ncbi:MAG TPA: peptide ABC transporter substrate-binding protein [Ktedonobacteraceae bacterium]|nr:peptide ABC transporter substrate-binding protein [Ktedonobacteraceae bacterium]